jgi:hypothetical protein
MNTVMYVGHGVEIEDDAVRLRRRTLEYRDDAARRVHWQKPPRRQARGPAGLLSAVIDRWR